MSKRNFDIELAVSRDLEGKKSFERVRRRTKAIHLELHADKLESLDGIGRALPNLEWLSIAGDRLRDVSGAMELKKLRALCMYYSKAIEDISSLVGHPTLSVVCLKGTKVERKSVPQPLRKACTWAWVHGAKLEGLAQRGAPARLGALPKDKRKRQTALRRLLNAVELDSVEQGLELAAVLGGDEFDAITKSIRYEKVRVNAASRHGIEHRLVSSAFKGNRGHYPMLGLLATAPNGTRLAKLRGEVRELQLIGKVAKGERPIRLEHLNALPLEKLEFDRFRLVGAPATLRELESMFVRETRLVGPRVADIADCPNLLGFRAQSLQDLTSLEGVEAMPRLESISLLWTGVRSLAPLRDHPTVQHLLFDNGIVGDFDVLVTLPQLEKITCLTKVKIPPKTRSALVKRGVAF